ncbi:MAG TPA: twin-arginine translocase TatA/TatE family subunit [Rariglobus sp.]|jgi:sec-independent protein translocase protein TatA|nr:twin-arginine translocase TatA/TatE family subunit [Rariglobus sp.]
MPTTPTFLAFIGGFGGGEIVLVLIVALILFGGERMPELARGLGKTIREFKKATSGVEAEIKRALSEPPPVKRTIKPVTEEAPEIPPAQEPPAPETPPHD